MSMVCLLAAFHSSPLRYLATCALWQHFRTPKLWEKRAYYPASAAILPVLLVGIAGRYGRGAVR